MRLPLYLAGVQTFNVVLLHSATPYHTARSPPTLTRGAIDTKFWHAYLEERRDHTWIDLPFFEAEVIFYHLLLNAVGYHDESSRDPFAERKRAGLIMADQDAVRFSEQLQSELALSEEALPTALSISLWANKADLSQLAMATVPGKLLVDHRSRAVDILGSPRASSIVDIVLDNSGAEFLGDLVLADVLLRSGIHDYGCIANLAHFLSPMQPFGTAMKPSNICRIIHCRP